MSYKYTGALLVGGIGFKRFDVHKFCIGKLHQNELISATAGSSGAHLSPNYLQSVFEIIARGGIVTILKKVNSQIDHEIKKRITRADDLGGFSLYFEALFNNGASRYFQEVEMFNARIIHQSHLREKGVGNLSVFTFQAEEEVKVFPMAVPVN